MKNVQISQDGQILTVKIDLSQTFGPSKSQKTIVIGSTEGNQVVAKDKDGKEIKLGLTVYKKP